LCSCLCYSKASFTPARKLAGLIIQLSVYVKKCLTLHSTGLAGRSLFGGCVKKWFFVTLGKPVNFCVRRLGLRLFNQSNKNIMTENTTAPNQIKIIPDSSARVAYDLMKNIAESERLSTEKPIRTREYWLTLFHQCLKAVHGSEDL
jgi:hypothetical protein